MAYNLVVTEPFGEYQKGDTITDQETVAEVLKNHPHRTVKVVAPDEPEAAEDASK